MNQPTEREALVFWLRAINTPYKDIAAQLGVSVAYATELLGKAQRKATAVGLSFKHSPSKIDLSPGSGSCHLVEVVQKQAPTPLKGMALLIAMADEAGLKK